MHIAWRTAIRSSSRRNLSIFIVALFLAIFVPMLSNPMPSQAVTDCSPNSVVSGGAGLSWLNGGGVNVCTTGDDSNNYVNNVNGVSTLSGWKWECVELVNRLYLTKGWTTANWSGFGNTLINNVPSGLVRQYDGAISYLNPGDVITLDNGGNGHAAIINSVGSSIDIINQNAPLHSTASVKAGTSFSAGNASLVMTGYAGYTVQGVVHHPTYVDGFGVFRLTSGTYYWYVKDGPYPNGSTFTLNGVANGSSGDLPVVGDFNGDGVDDFGVFRLSGGTYYWYVKDGRYPTGSTFVLNGVANGSSGDKPVVGDFNGDGISDFGVFRYDSGTSTYLWYVKDGRYPTGSSFVLNGVANGSSGDLPVVGDFNGDGIDDFGVARLTGGTYYWYVKDGRYPTGSTYVLNGVANGSSGDTPVVGDFNGDGIDDFGVFRYDSGTGTYDWYVKDGRYPTGSTFVYNGVPNGSTGDTPVVGYFGGQ